MRPTRLVPVLLTCLALGSPALASPAAAVVVHQTTTRVGTSVQGRPLVAVHRWTDGAARTVLVLGNMHGEEQAGIHVVRRLRTATLPAGVDLWLVPTLNPDGTAIDRRDNAHGVDLNRNFPTYFLRSKQGTTKWSGPRAASEPETRSMMALLADVRPDVVVSFHQPLRAVDSYHAKSMTLVRRLSRELGLPIASLDCHGGCHGTMTDWFNTHQPGQAVTVEFGYHPTAARLDRAAAALLRIAAPS